MTRAARILSYALHPLFMPLLTLWLALQLDLHLSYFLPAELRWLMLGMVALMTIAFPLTGTLLLIRAGTVSSLFMPERRERIAPYCMTLLYYGMTVYLLSKSALHPVGLAMLIGAFIALALTTLVTLRWKISAHMVGIGGCLGALLALNVLHGLDLLLPIAAVILLAGALGTARLLVSDHSPMQVFAGFLLGLASLVAAMLMPWGLILYNAQP